MYNDKLVYKVVIWGGVFLWKEKEALTVPKTVGMLIGIGQRMRATINKFSV